MVDSNIEMTRTNVNAAVPAIEWGITVNNEATANISHKLIRDVQEETEEIRVDLAMRVTIR